MADTYLGVDASNWQDAALPWPAWYAAGWRVAVARAGVGFYDDAHFVRYVTEAAAAGFVVGAYHAILGHQYYDPVKQAIDFLSHITPQVSFLVLDIEAPGVSAADVLAFTDLVEDHSALPLILYGNWDLAAILDALPSLKRFGIWWAAYPTYPAPTTNPPYAFPRNVPADLAPLVVGWQYAGENGRLPPYAGAIDLSTWYALPSGGPVPPADTTKVGIAGHARAIKELVK